MRLVAITPTMADHISESEMQRIEAFVETPAYKRSPDQLLPSDENGAEE